jgi:glycosyltransferase involved in cell wall biosynthesis
VEAVLPGEGPFTIRLRRAGLPTHVLNSKTYSNARKPTREIVRYLYELLPLAYRLVRLCKLQKTDLLYVNGPRFLPAAALAAWWLSKPLVFHCHHRIAQAGAVRFAVQSLLLSRAQVIACCQYTAQPFKQPCGAPLRVVYNGIAGLSSARLTRRHPIERIGVIGRIEPEKGQLEFVNAIRIIAPNFPRCTFSVVGAPLFSNLDYLKKVIQNAKDLPVQFTGWQDDIAAVFSNLDLLVVPSTDFDATPRVILEAFSAGVPVIACPTGGIPEIVQDNQTGFLAPDSSAAALAKTMTSVLTMTDTQLSNVVATANATWKDRFNLNQFQENVCSVVQGFALGKHSLKTGPSEVARRPVPDHSWQALESKTLLGDRRSG